MRGVGNKYLVDALFIGKGSEELIYVCQIFSIPLAFVDFVKAFLDKLVCFFESHMLGACCFIFAQQRLHWSKQKNRKDVRELMREKEKFLHYLQ